MFKKAAVLVASCGALMAGCGSDQQMSENEETIANLIEAGFRADDIMEADGQIVVGRDAFVDVETSREMLQRVGSKEQYRTTNLVDTSTVKVICVVPTSTFDSYSRLSAGLDAAINNYNSQGLSFTMVRGNAGNCDATISARTTSGVGGSAGFPKGGKPYGTINIGTGLQSYSTGVNTHVITHELGHCIGFRHSDYYDRSISCGTGLQSYSTGVNTHVITHELGHCIGFRHSDYYDRSISCGGSASNEGSAGVGAIHIPGTPTTATTGGSVMNSCFRSSESGGWSSSDRTALNYLY